MNSSWAWASPDTEWQIVPSGTNWQTGAGGANWQTDSSGADWQPGSGGAGWQIVPSGPDWQAGTGGPDWQAGPGGPAQLNQQELSEPEILELLNEREKARDRKDFDAADQIREKLHSYGIKIFDKEHKYVCSRSGREGLFGVEEGANLPEFDDQKIEFLLVEREMARLEKNFVKSDALREQLKVRGVDLFDREMIWTTVSGRKGKYPVPHARGPANPPGHAPQLAIGDKPSPEPVSTNGGLSQSLQPVIPPMKDHPTIPEEEIQAYVVQREQARESRDFATSDRTRDHLRSIGIELFDKEKIWRCHSGRVGIYEGVLKDEDINRILTKRFELQQKNEWDFAAKILTALQKNGVHVSALDGTWRTHDGRTGNYKVDGALKRARERGEEERNALPPEKRTVGIGIGGVMLPSEGSGPISEDDIVAVVMERDRARKAKDWNLADFYKDQLRARGVEIYDREREWYCTDGRRGRLPPATAFTAVQAVCSMSSVEIEVLLAQREEARGSRNFPAADEVRTRLRANGVEVNDKDRTWRTNDGRSGPYPNL